MNTRAIILYISPRHSAIGRSCLLLLLCVHNYNLTHLRQCWRCVGLQAEGEVQTLTKKVRSLEEEFEGTENRLQAATEKLDEASKAADESDRLFSATYIYIYIRAYISLFQCYCATVLIGRIVGLVNVRPSARLAVLYGLLTRKQKEVEQRKKA